VEDLEEIARFAKRMKPNFFMLSHLIPAVGSPVFDEAVRKGWLKNWDYRQYDMNHPVLDYGEGGLSFQEMREALNRVRGRFWADPRWVLGNLAFAGQRWLPGQFARMLAVSMFSRPSRGQLLGRAAEIARDYVKGRHGGDHSPSRFGNGA
jgi:hypothetical protein